MFEDEDEGFKFYDDDGNEINQETVSKPSLCITCKKNDLADPHEDMLCIMNRSDQRNETEFMCEAYEPKS